MEAEHLSQIQLVGYGAKTLNPDELLAVDRHLASCDACHDRLTRISTHVSDRSYDLPIHEPFHLDYDQHLVPYVDGTANEIDREIIESHIALCSSCAEDIRDLQEFKQQPVPPSPQAERDVRVSRWTRWTEHWPRPLAWNPQLTATLVIAVFTLGISTAVFMWAMNRSQQSVHRAGPTSTPGVDQQNPPAVPGQSPDQVANNPSPDPRTVQSPDPQRDEPLIALNDGGQQITIDERGHSTGLESLPPDLRTTVENVLARRKFNRSPALGNLSENTGRLRSGSDVQETIVPLTPDGVVIETDQPTFRWRPLEGASDYVVTVHDSNFRPVESSGPLAATEWCTTRPLPRGVTYSWQIRAVVNGKTVISPKPPAPEARFRVLDQKAFAAIQNARRTQGNAHLALGVLFWKHGLMDQAERELEALVRANPNSSAATELLRSLRSLRRR